MATVVILGDVEGPAKYHVGDEAMLSAATDWLRTRWPDLRINIEPKSDQAVDPLIALIRSTGSIDRVCVGSFNDRRVRKMRAALGPGLCTSIGVTPTVLLRLASWGVPFLDGFVRRSGAGCVQSPVKQWIVPVTDRRFVARCHGLGLQVQFARLGAGQVEGVLEDAQQGLGRFHDGGDVRVRLLVQRLPAQQFEKGCVFSQSL